VAWKGTGEVLCSMDSQRLVGKLVEVEDKVLRYLRASPTYGGNILLWGRGCGDEAVGVFGTYDLHCEFSKSATVDWDKLRPMFWSDGVKQHRNDDPGTVRVRGRITQGYTPHNAVVVPTRTPEEREMLQRQFGAAIIRMEDCQIVSSEKGKE
jgi:hypothetical protein